MDYDKLIANAATKLNSLVNEIIDTFDKAGTPVNPMRIISDITAKAFPEKDGVIQVDSSPEQIQDLEKEMGTEGSTVEKEPKEDDHFDEDNLPNDPNAEDNDWRTDQMKALSGEDWEEEEHFGEEQMADLRNLLNGVQGVM